MGIVNSAGAKWSLGTYSRRVELYVTSFLALYGTDGPCFCQWSLNDPWCTEKQEGASCNKFTRPSRVSVFTPFKVLRGTLRPLCVTKMVLKLLHKAPAFVISTRRGR